jgi:hypothetical protein
MFERSAEDAYSLAPDPTFALSGGHVALKSTLYMLILDCDQIHV